jgi:hypothetical protein
MNFASRRKVSAPIASRMSASRRTAPTANKGVEMRPRRLGWVFVFALLTSAIAPCQLSIDSTGPIRPRKHDATWASGEGVGRKIPLHVSIEVPVAAPDSTGKTLVEFVLSNSGKNNIDLPVSPHPGDFEPADLKGGYSVVRLGLRLRESGKPGAIFAGGADLFGSSAFPVVS